MVLNIHNDVYIVKFIRSGPYGIESHSDLFCSIGGRKQNIPPHHHTGRAIRQKKCVICLTSV